MTYLAFGLGFLIACGITLGGAMRFERMGSAQEEKDLGERNGA